jgi:NTP pyrophosphatase (non-canonical NTP hydrolase)
MTEIKQLIEQWAIDRNIDQYENRFQQSLKLSEEVGELCGAILKHKPEEIIDAIGDIQVVLIILCKQLDINYDRCLQIAWNTIKDRTGKTVNGSFIRDVEPKNK